MDYKQKFEPIGNKVIHGAGQSIEMFKEYWKALENNKPIIYMTYTKMQKMDTWVDRIQKEISLFPNLILQIGFNFTVDKEDATKDIYQGKYDYKLNQLFEVIKKFGNPVFLRLGYEFDKKDKYNPNNFVKAWQYIVDKYRKEKNINIANVWCACPYKGTSPVKPYYPGDNYVDWFGIDIFSKRHFANSKNLQTEKFLELAKKHKKPMMIGESSPARTGVDKGQKSWDEWFKAYFEWIENHPIIKAFCYINWDWEKDWKTPEWLNGRIHENEIVKNNFIKELKNPRFIHNQKISDFLNKVYH
jgi:beta-mannanase